MTSPLEHTLKSDSRKGSPEGFGGFTPPTSNTTYTPNQFFDVCLPHYSRGCVRLVAYLIRKTLGWCDEQGNPQAERHQVSWTDFQNAGISRQMIRSAIEEAIDGHFIRCVRSPRAQKAGQPAASGLYELQWDEGAQYIKEIGAFRGFFAGEGNRTYIPNQFFDHVIPREPLAVVKVVGSVIRFSIGFQNKWGHRRRNVSLSYQHIRNYSHLKDRTTLSSAIRHALKSNYIDRVEAGYFDPDAGKLSRAAVYAVKWLDSAADATNSLKTRPGKQAEKSQFQNPTDSGLKTRPGQRFDNPTGIEIKQTNKTYKQQPDAESAVSFEKLKEAGFDSAAAKALADRYSFDRVERQIAWLTARKIASNRLGMLRKAIEEDWAAPTSAPGRLGQPNLMEGRGEGFEQVLARTRRKFLDSSS